MQRCGKLARPAAWLSFALLAVSLIIVNERVGAATGTCREPAGCGQIHRVGPAGGLNPYGGGLLRWWPRNCFPRCGACDDYCRKPLPCPCWPPYPKYYTYEVPKHCPPACESPPQQEVPAELPIAPSPDKALGLRR